MLSLSNTCAGLAALLGLSIIHIPPVSAVPPAGTLAGVTALPEPKWIEHRVIWGERLSEIAERYSVGVKSIVKWNKLNEEKPRIRAGSYLRIYTRVNLPPREKIYYTVRRGDSWSRIAKKHGVRVKHLKGRWNPDIDQLVAGKRLLIWAEGKAEAVEKVQTKAEAKPEKKPEAEPETKPETREPPELAEVVGELPIVPVPMSSLSTGSPSRGRLRGSLKLPRNPALYTIRRPEHSYGSSHTLVHLQQGIAEFRKATGFDGEVVIKDLSRRGGGRLRPHHSHRTGRDVDVRLPLADGVPRGTVPLEVSQVDWDATWALLKALIDTGEVQYIFLSRSRQRSLRRAAERAGTSTSDLEALIQFPGQAPKAIIRHSRGHEKHFHVRFKCADYEEACRER